MSKEEYPIDSESRDAFKKEFDKICSTMGTQWFPSVLPPVDKIVVIGDIHGDWDMTIESLKLAKVIDSNNKWIKNCKTVIVQLGDQIDRCRGRGEECKKEDQTFNDENSDIKILNYFTELHNQAEKQGGAVYSLLGNHELMNVNGNLNYVSYAGLVGFSKDKVLNNGYKKRKLAFKKGGKYAKFLGCTRKGILVIGSNLFVHGGIIPELAKLYGGNEGIENINRIISKFLWDNDSNSDKNNLGITGTLDYSPFWNRVLGLAESGLDYKDDFCYTNIKPVLETYKVGRIVVGHTPQFSPLTPNALDKGINSTCGDRVWRADVGLSKAFGVKGKDDNRNIQVLEIKYDNDPTKPVEINILKNK